jgi:hypothetical protein
MAASKTPDVIDLTVSDHEVIEVSDNSPSKDSSKRKKRRKKRKKNNSSNTVTEAEDGEILDFDSTVPLDDESPATTDTQFRDDNSSSRRDTSKKSSRKRKSRRSPSLTSDSGLFVLDAQPSHVPETETPPQIQATTTVASEEEKPKLISDPSPSSDSTHGLLLPPHVSLQDANQESVTQLAAAMQTAIGDDDDDDGFIKFLDMDSYKVYPKSVSCFGMEFLTIAVRQQVSHDTSRKRVNRQLYFARPAMKRDTRGETVHI